ncbi:MAG: hypothetical protein RCG15_04150 [Candidatus Rickettsia vulgarisii]
MLNDQDIKQAMRAFSNLTKRSAPIELKKPEKGVAYKIKHKLSKIKYKVQKAFGR